VPELVGEAALAEFRSRLTGKYGLELLDLHGGRVLTRLPVGVGKSAFLDLIVAEAVLGGVYDLVVVLAPTRRLIRERLALTDPPAGVRVVELRSRPSESCGPERNALWVRYESAALGALGRAEVCGTCPLRSGCFWPGQYGKSLEGAALIFATQTHLELSPGFLRRLASWAGSERTLTLIDEGDFLGKRFGETIGAGPIAQFIDTLDAAAPLCVEPRWQHGRWQSLARGLRDASTGDLQVPWRTPAVQHDWAEAVQRVGVERHGDAFRFVGHKLAEFADSPLETRLRDVAGDIHFATRPLVGDLMLFSGTTDRAYASFRLGKEIASPFEDLRFRHPETRWYNISSPIGTRRNFPRHAPQVLDFFAGLTARRAAEGKRVVLVAKKGTVELCAAGLAARFEELGADLEVLTAGWSAETLDDPRVVPLIGYGMIGTNLFEGFDCAFCLNGFYVNEAVLDLCLQDLTRRDLRVPIVIETVGNPRRRRARVEDPEDRFYETARLVQPALETKEHGVVIQAVGRVRPFTRPREIITFQMGALPGVGYDAEFDVLAEARDFFGVPAGRERRRDEMTAKILALRGRGYTQVRVAEVLGISVRTVRNHENGRTGKTPSIITKLGVTQ
jgi:DNA-binding XRE family transcriptional regulator